jgi:hypothetical protein
MSHNSEKHVTFYSLFYLDESVVDISINLRSKQSSKYIVYLENAITLSKSLSRYGCSHILIVNDKKIISSMLENIGCLGEIKLQQIDFSLKVPAGINFYSAHFKIDVIKFLSQLEGYNVLLDLDVIAINPPSSLFYLYVKNNIPLYYDITDQVIPAYGSDIILSDMKKISPNVIESRWSGGEFLAGDAKFFDLLYKEVMSFYSNYVKSYKLLHHQGDEMLVSVALQIMKTKHQIYIADAGTPGIIYRYWSSRPKHPQKTLNYMDYVFLLHLPSDKDLLVKNILNRSSAKRYLYKKLLFRLVISKIYHYLRDVKFKSRISDV